MQLVLNFLKLYFIALSLYIFLDYLWLVLVARYFIRKGEEGVSKEDVKNWHHLFYFYFLFVLLLLVFAVFPSIFKLSFLESVLRGLILGFLVYGFYNLLSGLKKKDRFSSLGNIFDLFWSGVLSASISGISYLIYFNYLI